MIQFEELKEQILKFMDEHDWEPLTSVSLGESLLDSPYNRGSPPVSVTRNLLPHYVH
jgi:hypothetical protein